MATRGPTRHRLLRAGLAGFAVLVVAGIPAWAATGRSAPSCAVRGVATVVSSTEKDDVIQEVADRWNRDVRHLRQPCVQVVGITSGLAERRIENNGGDWTFSVTDLTVDGQRLRPGSTLDAWTPSASLWLRLLESNRPADAGTLFDARPRSLARSPLVAVGSPAAIATLRARTEKTGSGLGWPDLVAALHDSRRDLRYTQENALDSTSGAQAALLLSLNTPAGLSASSRDTYLRELQSATDSVNDSTTIIADWADRGVDPKGVMLLQAQMAWAFNNGYYSLHPGELEKARNDARPGPEPATKLDIFLPKPTDQTASTYESDHPFLVRTAGPNAAAMRSFYDYLRADVDRFCARGYFDDQSDCVPPPTTGPDQPAKEFDALPGAREIPVPPTAAETLKVWNALRTPRSLLVLVDVSGSQPEQTLQIKAAALAAASDRLRLDKRFGGIPDQLTVWAVGRTWQRVQPPTKGTAAEWSKALITAGRRADTGYTDLRGAVCAAQTDRSWVGDSTTASIVLLSDGVQDRNGTPRPGELNSLFPKGSVSRTCPDTTDPAPMYAIHYALERTSYQADHDALDRAGSELMKRLGGAGYRPATLDERALTESVRDILKSPAG